MERNRSNDNEPRQNCMNCLYEYTCDWENSSEKLCCDNWQSEKMPTRESIGVNQK